MRSFREGSQLFSLYNEGLVVYLYDQGSADALRAQQAAEVVVDGNVQDWAKKLKAIEKEHLIVAYELQGDGCPDVEVFVGEPLTAKEKKGTAWKKLQKTVISLPSGKLRLETPNSLTIGPESPDSEGGTYEAPPGDYLLTLHRVDFDNAEMDVDDLPTEVISLTPLAETKAPGKCPACLTWADVMGQLAAWERKWTIKDGVFRGLMNGGIINLSRQAKERLGLRWGQRLHLKTDDEVYTAVYTGPTTVWWAEATFGKELTDMWEKEVQGSLSPQMAMSGSILSSFKPFEEDAELEPSAEPIPVELTIVEPPLAPTMDLQKQLERRLDGDSIVGQVLACCPSALTINISWADLGPLKVKTGDLLVLECGGQSRLVVIQSPSNDLAISTLRKRKALATPGFKEVAENILGKQPDFYESEPYDREDDLRKKDRSLDAQPVPAEFGDDLPLMARQMGHWEAQGIEMYWLQPVLGNSICMNVEPGAQARLRKHIP